MRVLKVRWLMLEKRRRIKFSIISRYEFVNVLLVSNAFVWYSFAFSILKRLIHELTLAIWSVHFVGAALSAIAGAAIGNRIHKRPFLAVWMMLGILSPLMLVSINSPQSLLSILIMSLLFGISFGLGVPSIIGCLADCTVIENRAKLGGLTIFVYILGAFLLGIVVADDITLQALALTIWRALSLIIFLATSPSSNAQIQRSGSFKSIFNQRSFYLYFIPWTMFSLVNYIGGVVAFQILNENTVNLFIMFESVLIGIVAVIVGFLADEVGRKRITMVGFIMLGFGYAILGIYPENLFSWYFYTVADGVAWGIFWVIFVLTIWGDLSFGASSDKYYAIGGLPFYMSNFLRVLIGSYIAKVISIYAIFSFAALFLFLGVIPLMYAPETLPEKKLRERELKKYIEKAKKIKEKYG